MLYRIHAIGDDQYDIGAPTGYICLCSPIISTAHIAERLKSAKVVPDDWISPAYLSIYNVESEIYGFYSMRLSFGTQALMWLVPVKSIIKQKPLGSPFWSNRIHPGKSFAGGSGGQLESRDNNQLAVSPGYIGQPFTINPTNTYQYTIQYQPQYPVSWISSSADSTLGSMAGTVEAPAACDLALEEPKEESGTNLGKIRTYIDEYLDIWRTRYLGGSGDR
jgi:hypothetical protein